MIARPESGRAAFEMCPICGRDVGPPGSTKALREHQIKQHSSSPKPLQYDAEVDPAGTRDR